MSFFLDTICPEPFAESQVLVRQGLFEHRGRRTSRLQWRDIDLDTGLIQLERTRYRPKGGQDFLGPPKTFGSRRRIVVTREVVDELRRWKQSQQEIERESWTPESFVVRLPNSAPPSPASFNNAIQIARKELGLPPVSFSWIATYSCDMVARKRGRSQGCERTFRAQFDYGYGRHLRPCDGCTTTRGD